MAWCLVKHRDCTFTFIVVVVVVVIIIIIFNSR
jgi:hypothetical protein